MMKQLYSIILFISISGVLLSQTGTIKIAKPADPPPAQPSNPAQSSETKKSLGLIVKADIVFPVYILIDNKEDYSPTNNYFRRSYFSLSVEKEIKKRHSFQLTGVYCTDGIIQRTFIDH